MTLSFRTIWISDVHLGNPAARAGDLLNFLDSVTCEQLYLVGDIIDLERMRVRPVCPERHLEVVRRFFDIALRGTHVVYIPGNHDHEFRDLVGRDLCGIEVAMEAAHETLSGQTLLIAHGDILDREICQDTNLHQFGSAAYRIILQLDAKINELRHRLGRDHLSISRRIKESLASANEYMRRFEATAARYAKTRGYDGIVCGHIHRPGMRMIDGVRYANDGDWVEHRSALAETETGELRLLRWADKAVHVERPVDTALLAA